MRWAVLVAAALLLALAAPAAAANAAVAGESRAGASERGPAGRASEEVSAQLALSRVPAAAWAVVDGDRVVLGARGGGVDGNTPFVLGSVSKSFTALAITQLVDRGRVRLDAPVEEYLPGFTTATPDAVITVRQLLDQTSGLPTSAGLALLLRPRESLGKRVRAIPDVALASTPGREFHYCNLNHAVLGLVVQRVTGVPFGGLVVLAGGSAAPLSRAFQHSTAIVAAIAVIALVLLVTTSTRRWGRLRAGALTGPTLRRAAARDLLGAVALCLLVVVGAGLVLQGGPLDPRITFALAPDVTSIVVITAATLALRATGTLRWASEKRPPTAG